MTEALEIVIVSFNTREVLERCLASLDAHPPAGLERIVVVDNASEDDTVAHVQASWPRVQVVALEHNVGFGAANNVALREPGPPLVLLLNSDTVVPAGAIDRLIGRLVATSSAAAGPRLVDERGQPEISFGPMLSPLAEARQAFRQRMAAGRGRFARRYVARLVAKEQFVDWVSGACLLARRKALLEAGLFDERFFMYEEDVDLCAALRENGGRILFTPEAEVAHVRGRSSGSSRASQRHYDRSHLAFYEKHLPAWTPWLRAWQRMRGRGIR